jgi:glycosyltransferase involved in cell wall biosynthesis
MTIVTFVIPGSIDLPTGGYGYDRRVLKLLPQHGFDVRHLELPGSFPAPSETDLMRTAELIRETQADSILLIDGLAYDAMPESLIAEFHRKIVALVHHPLCLEAGLPEARAREFRSLERRALSHAAAVIATSQATAGILADAFSVPANRLSVAEPGTDRTTRARGTGAPLKLLAVGSVIPRKGYDVLVEALRAYCDGSWMLEIVGGLDLAPDYAKAIVKQIAAANLSVHIRLLGTVDPCRLAELYDKADLFVMPSRYEGYGMVMTEAMARGLAIVCTTGVAATDTIPHGAVLRVEADDVSALASALGKVIDDSQLRRALGEAAWSAAQKLPTWADTAKHVSETLRRVAQ